MNKCIFLDRDGVLNQDLEGYLFQTELLQFPEGVKEGLADLKKAGFLLIVITNQAGIAKGLYDGSAVEKIHNYMNEIYDNALDDLYFAPHHEAYTTKSLSRKPGALMIERAAAKYHIDMTQSWMIGDNERDIEAGSNAGAKTILLKTSPTATKATYQATTFKEAVRKILSEAV